MTETWPDARDRFPFLDHLERHVDVFREEFEALPASCFIPMPSTEMYQGVWTGCVLQLQQYGEDFPGLDFAANRARCPRTWALLQEIDGLVVGGFLRLAPGAYLLPHEDIRDDNVIRAHLGLKLAPHEHAYWREGTARLMDIRVRHSARNPSTEPRVTLMVDVRMPFAIPTGVLPPWNPDLTPLPSGVASTVDR